MQHRTRLSHLTSSVSGIALGVAVSGSIVATSTQASAQAFKFPSSNVQAGNGLFTTPVLTTHELRAQYAQWKTNFLVACNAGELRVQYPESGKDTRSEAMGYGMVIAAYMGDQTTFDGLLKYYQRASTQGLMNWHPTNCGATGATAGDNGSAADADVDAAFALVVANKQWPGQYTTQLGTILGAVRARLFLPACQGILLAGSQFAACGCINGSYIPTGYYPAFGAADTGNTAFWTTARTNSYTYFQAASNDNTGLIPAWSTNTGSTNLQCPAAPQVGGGGQANQFQADAARAPWRVSVDYAWTANASAKTFLSSIAAFAKTQPVVSIVSVYNLDGTPQQGMVNGGLDAEGFRSTFVPGGFASAMMTSSQEDVDSMTGAWQSMYLPGDSVSGLHAFNSSLALLYGLNLTGLMWNPVGADPTPVTEPALNDQPGNLLTNGDFDEGFRAWSFANLAPTTNEANRAQGYAMHRDGELQIRVQRAAPVLTNTYEIRLSQPVSLQAGQTYVMSLKARAANPRPLHVAVEGTGAGNIVVMGNRRDATAPITVTADMQTYDWVFTAPALTDAKFEVDSGDSTETLIIDDVLLAPSTLPVSVAGDQPGQPGATTPGTTDGTTPPAGGGTTPPAGGGGTTQPGGSTQPGGPTGQLIPNQNDLGSTPGGSAAASSSGVTGAPVSGGLPPAPAGRPASGNGSCTSDTDCGSTFKCSTKISLCYEPTYGYVWDANLNGGQGGWSQPPITADCSPYVFWPLKNGCYDPVSGYAFDPTTGNPIYVGDNYTTGQDKVGGSKGGCSVSRAEANGPAPLWALFGALGTVLGLAYRRRR